MAKSKTELEDEFRIAALEGNTKKVCLLIKDGIDVDCLSTLDVTAYSWQASPLWSAAEHGKIPILTILLDAKANVNMQNTRNKATPLNIGVLARTNRVEVTQLLLKAGANVDIPEFQGNTPLHRALHFSKHDSADDAIFSLLVGDERKPKVNLKNDEGFTPLRYAIQERSSPKICSELVRRGAKLDIKHLRCFFPEELAKEIEALRKMKFRGMRQRLKLQNSHYNKIQSTSPFYKTGYLILFANLIEQEHLQQHPEDHLLILLNAKDKKLLDETINKILNEAQKDFFNAHQKELKSALEKINRLRKTKMSDEEQKTFIIKMLSGFLKQFFLGERDEALFWQPYIEMLISNALDTTSLPTDLEMEILKFNHLQPLGFVEHEKSPFSKKGAEHTLRNLIKKRIQFLVNKLKKLGTRTDSVEPSADRGDSKQFLELAQSQAQGLGLGLGLGGEAERKQAKEPQEKPTPEPVSVNNILLRFAIALEKPKQESKEGKELQEQEREQEKEPSGKPKDQKP